MNLTVHVDGRGVLQFLTPEQKPVVSLTLLQVATLLMLQDEHKLKPYADSIRFATIHHAMTRSPDAVFPAGFMVVMERIARTTTHLGLTQNTQSGTVVLTDEGRRLVHWLVESWNGWSSYRRRFLRLHFVRLAQ